MKKPTKKKPTNLENLNGTDLLAIGWETGSALGSALQVANNQINNGTDRDVVLAQLKQIESAPDSYLDDTLWAETASQLVSQKGVANQPQLREELAPLSVWGKHLIDEKSFEQIENTAKLPVTMRVALMPDAHVGYGLPIGGVAALEGAIAPYMVGVDIGCRMHASIYSRNPIHLEQDSGFYKETLLKNCFFARSTPREEDRLPHPILDDPRWEQLPQHLRGLKDTAALQLGSSGGGNHFVEWTSVTVTGANQLGIDLGKYIAVVSHSGSRGVGYKIANYYTQIAEKVGAWLPKNLRKLAYLDYRVGDGEEYEMAMSLAGDFAKACHEIIHERMRLSLGVDPIATVQNHHNFAWRIEREGDSPVFVHRKGATPADRGTNGIIPGSMATPGFFVEGRCNEANAILDHPSLNSAAHGSGRVLGRRQASERLDSRDVRQFLQKKGVTLLGGGIDEAPGAYKNSRDVIAAQSDLVKVWAEFEPRIVRMASDRGRALGEPTRDKRFGDRRKKKKRKR